MSAISNYNLQINTWVKFSIKESQKQKKSLDDAFDPMQLFLVISRNNFLGKNGKCYLMDIGKNVYYYDPLDPSIQNVDPGTRHINCLNNCTIYQFTSEEAAKEIGQEKIKTIYDAAIEYINKNEDFFIKLGDATLKNPPEAGLSPEIDMQSLRGVSSYEFLHFVEKSSTLHKIKETLESNEYLSHFRDESSKEKVINQIKGLYGIYISDLSKMNKYLV